MRTDRELLELAAKAAGIGGSWDWLRGESKPCCYRGSDGRIWSPLTDDGDALRLAVKLRITVELTARTVLAAVDGAPSRDDVLDLLGADPSAATRRAIVLAAAEVGDSMP